ncbi:MAG: EsaB/YukD family protein [Roseburia sp.]|uniref:EsaB/YukD family protein n=1 Tax=Roseburia sp. 831b TaxID=1261635 RepID=UPI0009533B8D|nr:EsaB/YukD family protein [Roseburia sp. 831b]MCI5917799.1 EsaB/YukD family protein [Roseburia sp.]MDD6215648.1 EsaB/YukD family protein [Roseburia sp.]MDY5883477.1 EsaB/YukD family protein [Roseburia sp.]WVK73193.1 EsaB/YukD family protein [Roseburia sp. 831b]
MEEKAVVVFINQESKKQVDLEIPLEITANDLVLALNEAYGLGIDTNDIFNCYLVAENPIAFLRGNKTLKEFGIRNGSYIIYRRG